MLVKGTRVLHYNLSKAKKSPILFMPTFDDEHSTLLGLGDTLEPKSSHHFDQGFAGFEEILGADQWDLEIDGPLPVQKIDCRPQNWYTRLWAEAVAGLYQAVDWDGHVFRDLFDYEWPGHDNISIHTGDYLDWY